MEANEVGKFFICGLPEIVMVFGSVVGATGGVLAAIWAYRAKQMAATATATADNANTIAAAVIRSAVFGVELDLENQ